MNFRFIKRGIALIVLASIFAVTGQNVLAAEKKNVLTVSQSPLNNPFLDLNIQVKKQAKTNIKKSFSHIGFARVEEGSFLYIMKDAAEDSEWVGKLYQDNALIVTETVGEWSKIESGNVKGYVKTELLITEQEAFAKAREILQTQNPRANLLTLEEEEVASSFSYGETKEEEEARLIQEAEEDAARRAAEEQAKVAKRQAVVDYAKQFLGNRYVWGGTSLTRGADCSGFVKSVYAHFGYTVPHSSYAQRRVGIKVKYSEIQPGDIVCYAGHVGIYAGNGQIVNALNERKGIVMSPVTKKPILAVRRLIV